MNSSYVTQLFDLVLSPTGFIGIMVGLLIVVQALRIQPLAWVLFSLCCFCASLAKFRNQFILEPPPLVFPLQQLREFGRPITIILLGMLLILTLAKRTSWRKQVLASPIKYLIVVQLVIFLKTLSGGSLLFAAFSSAVFALVTYVVIAGPAKWVNNDQSFQYAIGSIALVGLVFLGVNGYQAVIDIYPITFSHGRLNGTTGNAQHAAVLLATTIPCFLFWIETQRRFNLKLFGIVSVCLIGLALAMTGSRTGMCMAITTILFFYRNKGKSFINTAILLGIVSVIIVMFLGKDGAILGADQTAVSARLLSTEHTRQLVWKAMWRAFSDNLVFGMPLVKNRLGYGESSWLAAGASLGLVGFIPLLLFGVECLRSIWRLGKLAILRPRYSNHCDTIIAGVSCLLVGSFFEPFLLGNLSFALFALLTYLSLGQYLLEVQKVQESYYQLSKNRTMSIGVS
ncbi:MAG: O-antigen ligase family protein [Cyanobacteria bacterium J06623_5]